MKKFIPVFLSFFLGASAMAQITIDSTDFGSVGDNVFIGVDSSTAGVSISAGSATAQSWDFSALDVESVETIQFLDVNAVPSVTIPGANMVMLRGSQYDYFNKSASSLNRIGLYGDILGLGYILELTTSPGDRYMDFTSTYGSTFSSTSIIDSTVDDVYTGTFDSLRVKRVSVVDSDIDAFGSLVTPGGTFPDVLRQYYHVVTYDTAWGLIPFINTWTQVLDQVTETHEYFFIAENQDYYVLRVTADGQNGNVESAGFTVGSQLTATGVTTPVLCNGDATGTIDVTVLGGVTPYTYAWNTGETTEDLASVAAGSYTVTVTDGLSDTTTASFTVNEPLALGVNDSIYDETFGADGGVYLTVTGGTPSYTFDWNTGETTRDITGLSAGTYTVTITDVNSCQATYTFTVGNNTSVDDITANNNLKMFPNPAKDDFTITSSGDDIRFVEVYSLTGSMVYNWKGSAQQVDVNLEDFNAGLYIIQMQVGEQSFSSKLIVE